MHPTCHGQAEQTISVFTLHAPPQIICQNQVDMFTSPVHRNRMGYPTSIARRTKHILLWKTSNYYYSPFFHELGLLRQRDVGVDLDGMVVLEQRLPLGVELFVPLSEQPMATYDHTHIHTPSGQLKL